MTDAPLYVPNREEWRAWLEKHHASESEVWLVYFKKHTGRPRVSYDEAVEEALCFGWIDSIVKTLDEDRYMQKFTPRVNARMWSRLNLQRVEKLIAQGRMTAAGLAKLPADVAPPAERYSADSPLPDFFAAALKENAAASERFAGLAPALRRNIVRWVTEAKKEETRQRRLAEAIRRLERGERWGMK
ncbi:MAG TPA: YdeI/OmpD-associated family protein [Thermoanaerobaculia bacterium]|jgi:uncharacterized protein YdeI (YjbR/CyaY-like superfamily)|nr:YdeI/OmpD-associated family protein [Thermoanaerobaculia bacterium]